MPKKGTATASSGAEENKSAAAPKAKRTKYEVNGFITISVTASSPQEAVEKANEQAQRLSGYYKSVAIEMEQAAPTVEAGEPSETEPASDDNQGQAEDAA